MATLGKLPGLNEEVRVGWERLREILDGRLHQEDLLHADPDPPVWAAVDTSRAQVERLRRFGEVYLGLALWRRLKLDVFLDEAVEAGREAISWGTMACILSLARFCSPSSELQIAEFWYGKTALDDLLGVAAEQVNDDRLYRALRDRSTAERRVGRLFQKYSRAARFFRVDIGERDDAGHKSGKRLSIRVEPKEEHGQWAELTDGCYLLRTNLKDWDAVTLWKTHIGLSQIEDSFRINKHDLGLRPIYDARHRSHGRLPWTKTRRTSWLAQHLPRMVQAHAHD